MKKTILVTGARGYIASYIQNSNKDKFNWIKMTRDDADFSNPDEVEKFVNHRNLIYVYILQQMQLLLCVKKIQSLQPI